VAALYEPRLVPPRIPVQVNPTVLSQHVGRYRLAGGGMLTVDLRDAGLHMQIDAPRADALLQPESPTSLFADGGDPRLRYVFRREPDERISGVSIVRGDDEVISGEKEP
jgi:hypothetical protein